MLWWEHPWCPRHPVQSSRACRRLWSNLHKMTIGKSTMFVPNYHGKPYHFGGERYRKLSNIFGTFVFFHATHSKKKNITNPSLPDSQLAPLSFFLGGQIAQLRGPGFFLKVSRRLRRRNQENRDSTEGRHKKRRFGSANENDSWLELPPVWKQIIFRKVHQCLVGNHQIQKFPNKLKLQLSLSS